jgi:hypothetical protein
MPVQGQACPAAPGLNEGFYLQLYDMLNIALSVGAVAASSTVTQILAATTGIGPSGEKDKY